MSEAEKTKKSNSSHSHKSLCAFCRLPRKVYGKKDLSTIDVVLALGAVGFLSSMLWSHFFWKGFLLGLISLSLMQGFVRLRWRSKIACGHCGFDPIVYKREPQLAADRVSDFMKKRKESPAFLLRSKPGIPTKTKKVEVAPSSQLLLTEEEKLSLIHI